MRNSRKRLSAWLLGAALLLAASGYDLYKPVRTDLRQFDPIAVARLDTEMWRSYYARQRVRLFTELAELLRVQFGLPYLRSYRVAFHGARAAFLFKKGSNAADYEQALPDLLTYFAAINDASRDSFNVEQAARRELDWWICHREHGGEIAAELVQALAEAAGALYNQPAANLAEYARLRAEAMALRDRTAAGPGAPRADWARIQELLSRSWFALWQSLQKTAPQE